MSATLWNICNTMLKIMIQYDIKFILVIYHEFLVFHGQYNT